MDHAAALAEIRALVASAEAAVSHLECDHAKFASAIAQASESLRIALAATSSSLSEESSSTSIRVEPQESSNLSTRTISPSKAQLAVPGISAVLIDLDGTIYNPRGMIPGAEDFYAFLCRHHIPYVFLSNTGAKGAAGVREKLQRLGDFYMRNDKPPVSKILTAAEAQAAFMLDTIPRGAKIFAISGGSDPSFWLQLLHTEAERSGCAADLVASWEIRTDLTDNAAKEWAVAAAAHQRSGSQHVFVVLFFDGAISATVDPQTGEPCHAATSDCFRMLLIAPIAADCFRWLPTASDGCRWLPNASDCFRLLPIASDCSSRACRRSWRSTSCS